MIEVTLLQTTGYQAINHILKGIIGFCELLFPGRIRGYYLQGSYASGEATPASDIDLVFVFKGNYESMEEKKRARCVDTFSEWLIGRQLDIIPTTETDLVSTEWVDAATITYFKHESRLLYGEDIRSTIPTPTPAAFSRSCFHHALRAISWHHHHPQPLRFPLRYPDESAEFYGLNQSMHSVDDTKTVGTERLVYAVVRAAGALVALKTEQLVSSKQACVQTYRALVADEWADFVTEVFQVCHNQWHYQIPTGERDRRRLRSFYAQALAFENAFLAAYHEVLLRDLNSSDEQLRSAAAERLVLTFR